MKAMDKSKKNQSAKKIPLRVQIKCSWSGSRIQVPDTYCTTSSSLSSIVESVSSQLPVMMNQDMELSSSSGSQPSLVYLRKTVWKKDWMQTTVADILGNETSGGSLLLTLNLPGLVDSSPTPINSSMRSEGTELIKRTDNNTSIPMDIDTNDISLTLPANRFGSHDLRPNDEKELIIPNEAIFLEEERMQASLERQNIPFPPIVIEQQPVSITTVMDSNPTLSPTEAISKLLESNFDIASKECLQTILKILGNIIAKPHDSKVRSLRLSNPVIHEKIGSKIGGCDILLSFGFEYVYPTLSVLKSTPVPESIHLPSQVEDLDFLILMREKIVHTLTNSFQVPLDDIPPLRLPVQQAVSPVQSNLKPSVIFDPFKSLKYNTQSAAVGAPNPYSVIPDGSAGPSLTEQRLEQLKRKQMLIEQELHQNQLVHIDRNLAAFRPMQSMSAIVTLSTPTVDDNIPSEFLGSTRGDASLLANQAKKNEEERKKREEGGFTTSAMRDLEKMMKAKVYSHTQLRIDFPDGSWLSAKFFPQETVATIRHVILSALTLEFSHLIFDLYITPPRRILQERKTLAEEGLVPAAKIRVAWKEGYTPSLSGSLPGFFLRMDLFSIGARSENLALSFPNSVAINDGDQSNNRGKRDEGGGVKSNDDKFEKGTQSTSAKEDALIRRMLGKTNSFMRPKE